MDSPRGSDPYDKWLNTLSWPDRVIARCFPRFFRRYAPEEIQKQWAEHLDKKRTSRK